MLDAIAPGAAVFEPEEVDVLAAACRRALRKIGGTGLDGPDVRDDVAKLVHNLGRSRLRHRKRLRDAADAVTLAEEATDLLGYLRQAPDMTLSSEGAPPMARAVSFFPAELRAPPTTLLKPRAVEPVAAPAKRKRTRVNVARPGSRSTARA